MQDRPCLELMFFSNKFQALLFLQDKLLESVGKLLIPVKSSKHHWTCPFQNEFINTFGADSTPETLFVTFRAGAAFHSCSWSAGSQRKVKISKILSFSGLVENGSAIACELLLGPKL